MVINPGWFTKANKVKTVSLVKYYFRVSCLLSVFCVLWRTGVFLMGFSCGIEIDCFWRYLVILWFYGNFISTKMH